MSLALLQLTTVPGKPSRVPDSAPEMVTLLVAVEQSSVAPLSAATSPPAAASWVVVLPLHAPASEATRAKVLQGGMARIARIVSQNPRPRLRGAPAAIQNHHPNEPTKYY